jgi:hypothetical protein
MEITERTWKIEDHRCHVCGGRILRCVNGCGPTPGGNPIYRCADCGLSKAGNSPSVICWCGFEHRGQRNNAYRCVPYSILSDRPELLEHFLACGCDPKRGGDVGIMLTRDFQKRDGDK